MAGSCLYNLNRPLSAISGGVQFARIDAHPGSQMRVYAFDCFPGNALRFVDAGIIIPLHLREGLQWGSTLRILHPLANGTVENFTMLSGQYGNPCHAHIIREIAISLWIG